MARNAIESDFRSSKMAQKGLPKGTSKMAAGGHFGKKIQKKKSCVLILFGETTSHLTIK